MSTCTQQQLPRMRSGAPRLRRVSDVLEYWAERIELHAPPRESFDHGSLICHSDSLFHYGTHFELARILRDKRGRTRLVLLNGDLFRGSGGWGPSTSSRQDDVRSAVAESNAPAVTVPFSALVGAGIDIDSIMPVATRSERWTQHEYSSREQPHKKLERMPDPSGATTTREGWGWNHDTGKHEYGEHEEPVYVDNPNRTQFFSAQGGWCREGATRDEDGVWRWTIERHWLGDSVFRARYSERRTRKPTGEELAVHEAHAAWSREQSRLADIESDLRRTLFRFEPARRSFGSDYRRMLREMFAAEGLRQRYEEANAAAIEHRSAQVWSNGIRNGRMPITVTRWATFLSSFDYQESNPLYFLCELPYGAKPNTVDEAIEALKPPEVVAALARGLNVIRQGDLFAIPTKLTKRQLARMRGRQGFTKRLRVLGTNHSVTEGIVCKGGAVFGRGVMRHEPEGWRAPDHAQQKLGESWHLLVRNTVPRTK